MDYRMRTLEDLLAADNSLLIVDDDKAFLNRLERAMEKRGFAVTAVDTVESGLAAVAELAPAFAVVDMRLEDGNGLDVISAIHDKRPEARVVMLTGYGNITTAVTAVKLGAVDYLAKPADADDVVKAFMQGDEGQAGTAGQSDVGRSRPLGAHPARL